MSVLKNFSLNVLVVEDNSHARQLLADMLAMLGHTACCAETAEEAVKGIASQSFDVLLSDINLPGMSGIELASIALKAMPRLKIIFASGFGYLVADKTDFHFVLLPKPFGMAQLIHALEQACGSAEMLANSKQAVRNTA